MSLITIIIPTQNRQVYAAAAVHKITEVLPSAQIIVSDTSADDSLRHMLPDASVGSNVSYVRPGRPLDVVSHFEFALNYATGRYVMFLGDDDCIGPGLEEIAIWAEQKGVDAVFSYGTSFLANYFWPGVKSRFYGDGYASSLFVRPFTGTAKKIDPIVELRKTLRDFGRGLGAMPRAYHGLVSLELINKVKKRYGSLFGGVSPDIYSATLLSALASNVWQVDYPFCLPGGSPSSTAGTGAARTDITSLEENPHTAAFDNLQWDALIPSFYTPDIVWAFSLKKAVDRLERSDLVPNYARLYALCLLWNREHYAKVMPSLRHARSLQIGWYNIGKEMVREVAFQAKRFAKRLIAPKAGGGAKHFSNLCDISSAYDCLNDYTIKGAIDLKLPK